MQKLALVLTIAACSLVPRGYAQTREEMIAMAKAKAREMKQEELVNLETETARALQWNTGTFFRRVYGDDFVGILPSGKILSKAEWIAAIESSGVQYTSFVA